MIWLAPVNVYAFDGLLPVVDRDRVDDVPFVNHVTAAAEDTDFYLGE